MRLYLLLLVFIVNSINALCQCSFTVSVSSTESKCRESGTINVSPSAAGAYLYEITSGPSLVDPNSNPTFSNMPAGNYIVTTTLAGCSINTPITVAGNYQEPGLLTASTTKIACPDGTGCITANQPSLGKAPYTYSIIAGPVTRGLQSSNAFCNLPGGLYSVQAQDSCGVVRTSQFTVAVDTGDFYAYTYGYSLSHANCTDLIVPLLKGFTNTSSHSLMKIWYIKPNGDTLKVNGFEPYNSPSDTLTGESHSYGTWTVLAYDTCGRLRTSTFPFSAPGYYGNVSGTTCNNYSYHIANTWKYGLTVTYTVRKCSDNSVVGTVTQAPPATTFYGPDFILEYDTCYRFELSNTCGDTLRSGSYTIARPPLFNIEACSGPACNVNGKSDITIWGQYQTGVPPYNFTILSGPEGTGSSSVQDPGSSFTVFRNLAPGTYQIEGTDACGNKDTIAVIADKPLIRTTVITQRPNCSGGANIHIKLTSNFYNCNSIAWYSSVQGPGFDGTTPVLTPVNISSGRTSVATPGFWEADFINVSAGTVRFYTYTYEGCRWDTTFNVDLYVAPVIQNAKGYVCPATGKSSMSFTQVGGVAPYQYRIKQSSSSTWGAWQNNTVFDGQSPGLYDVEVRDSCPNGSITSVNFVTWEKSVIRVSAPPCNSYGSPVTFTADPVVPGVSYQWLFNGSVIGAGPSYTLPDYQSPNNGTYKLRQIFRGGNCTDSTSLFYGSCFVLPLSMGRLLGEFQYGAVTLSWKIFEAQQDTKSIIERSSDGVKFEQLGIADAGNLTNDRSGYQFKDKSPLPNGFYRIKVIQRDGTVEYSNIVNITNTSLIPAISVSPVPFTDWITVRIDSKQTTNYQIKILDFSGITVYKKNVSVSLGINTIKLEDRVPNLISGIYIIEITSGDFSYKQRMMKN